MTNAISTSALTRRYRDGAALDDVTVDIADRFQDRVGVGAHR